MTNSLHPTLALCAALSVATGAFASEQKPAETAPQTAPQTAAQAMPLEWRVSSRLFASIPSAKEWLIKKASDGKWEIAPRAQKSDESVESLLVDAETKTVYLNVGPSRTTLHPTGSSAYRPDECSFGLLSAPTKPTTEIRSNDRRVVGLTVCNSAFTKGDPKTTAGKVLGVLSLAYGSLITQMSVKTDELRAAIGESKLIQAVQEANIQDYRIAFATATSVGLLNSFIGRYSEFDPEVLVPKAIQKRDELLQIEQEERTKKDAEDQAARMAARMDQLAKAQAQAARDAEFQRKLRTEMETNCGLILEIKDSLIKVYFPVRNFGNEHWVNRASLSEPGARNCALADRLK